jgi:DeoR/GlpR family transcriptional regulator of sugar metabolism
MFPYERHEKILSILSQNDFVSVLDLRKELACSMATLQRDLTHLETEKRIFRTHGGVTAVDNPLVNNRRALYKMRQKMRLAEKKAIGRAAQRLIEAGDIVFITHGTTTSEIAAQLAKNIPLTVVTDGLDIVARLQDHPKARVILTGGQVNYDMHYVASVADDQFLRSLNYTKVFMGAGGLSVENGVSFYEMPYAEYFKMIVRPEHHLIVAVDHTKVGRNALARFVDMSRVNTVVTDKKTDRSFITTCRKQGVNVVVAET